MKNLKLLTKIGLGFGAVIILIVFVAIIGNVGFSSVVQRVANQTIIREAYTEAVMALRAERNFMDDRSEKHLEGATKAMEALKNKATIARDQHFKSPDDQDKMTKLIKLAEEYSKDFTLLVQANTITDQKVETMRGLSKTLLEAINALEVSQSAKLVAMGKTIASNQNQAEIEELFKARVEKIDTASEIAKDFLDARIGEKEVLLSRGSDEKDIKHNHIGIAKATELTDKLLASFKDAKDIETGKAVANALVNYKKGFEEVLAKLVEQDNLEKNLVTARLAIKDLVDTVSDDQNKKLESEIASSKQMISFGSLFGVGLGLILAYMIAKGLVNSITGCIGNLIEMSEGRIAIRCVTERGDEIGDMSRAIDKMAVKLREVVEQITIASGSVTDGAAQLADSAQTLSQGATEQAASIEETSSAMEQMSSNIAQNTENAETTEKISRSASENAAEGGQAVSEAVGAMKEIASKISIIEEIARQTNLLALNAAIEAARAGEHGKGFAVVAAEVRKLAERSQTAAGEISQLSNSSVQVAERAGHIINELVPNIQRTAQLVQEIASASREQSQGSSQINTAISQLDQVIQRNAGAAEEMAATADEMNEQSQNLANAIGFFDTGARPPMAHRKISTPKSKPMVASKRQDSMKLPAPTHKKGGADLDMGSSHAASDADFETF
ncbi:MAG: hypothetical protein HQL78_00645 [Magnetococcales bacterium]|nr:hypothetical protein [Magnetococcales bacterium]MBF0418654.1 hypothetical protein [Magnetococcales bacterium]